MKKEPDNVSAMFDVLAETRQTAKADEQAAVEKRRKTDTDIVALPEFKAIAKEKGAVTLRSSKWQIEVEYTVGEKRDMEKITKELPIEAIQRIFPNVRTFSQTAFNTYLKELRNEALTDKAAHKLLTRIEASMAENTTRTPGAPQIKVTPVAD